MNHKEIYLTEDIIYETLITTINQDNTINTKPIGIIIHEKKIIMNLYPNNTLNNIKRNNEFTIQFTTNALLYTKALFNKYKKSDYTKNNKYYYLSKSDYIIYANVIEIDNTNKTTKIIAEVQDTKKINKYLPSINRATNHILEFLIKYTRINMMTYTQKQKFKKSLMDNEEFIKKVGNQDHIDSLNILKKEIEKIL